MNPRPIILLGYMCSGKTTLGQALAQHLNRPFLDLDAYIEERQGYDIRQIFDLYGEPYFRGLETAALQEVLGNGSAAIVAVGGGTPCHGRNMELINAMGHSVWLRAPEERLVERLIAGGDSRPLTAGKSPEQLRAFVNASLETRTPFYSRAAHTFDSSRLEDEGQVAESVKLFINSFKHIL